jgi:sugar-specific transcriptional regulator TrmB
MLKTLLDSTVDIKDAQLYVHLVINGPKNVKEISTALKVNRQHVYRVVKQLRERQFIVPCSADCSRFNAVPFDKVLDLLLQSRLDEAKLLETAYRLTDKKR